MDLIELRRAARWKYELGRMLIAAPAGLAALLLVFVVLWVHPYTTVATALALGALLVSLSLAYSVWGGPLARAVFPALGAALLPFALPPIAFRVAERLGLPMSAELCFVSCLVSGAAAAGFLAWVARGVVRGRRRLLVAAGFLAAVGGAMSCTQFGMNGVGPMLLGLGATLIPVYLLARPRPTG